MELFCLIQKSWCVLLTILSPVTNVPSQLPQKTFPTILPKSAFSPIKGNDASQQKAPLFLGEFAKEEKTFSNQEICRGGKIWSEILQVEMEPE